MNRRFFLRQIFCASLAGIVYPAVAIEPCFQETTCVKRIYSQAYLEAIHNEGKPLDLDELFRLCLALKRARQKAGLGGQIVLIPNPELRQLNAVI